MKRSLGAAFLLVAIAVNLIAAEAPLLDAARRGDLVQVRALLGRNVDVNTRSTNGGTALHVAVEQDNAPMVDLLLRSGANVRASNRYGVTPLYLAALNSNAALFSTAPAIDAATGNLTYRPAADASGTANITVTLHDDGGTANGGIDTSPPQTFAINVTAVNDAPSFTAGANAVVSEDSGAASLAWATAISAGPANEAAQTLTFTANVTTGAGLFSVAPAISPTGQLTFTPAANAYSLPSLLPAYTTPLATAGELSTKSPVGPYHRGWQTGEPQPWAAKAYTPGPCPAPCTPT